MNLKDMLSGCTEPIVLMAKHEDKDYKILSTLEMAQGTDKDYILIPLGSSDILACIQSHMEKNSHCKGFFVSEKEFSKEEFKKGYYKILQKYPSQVELSIVDENLYRVIYNLAFLHRSRLLNLKTIIVVGAIGKSTTAALLSKMLGEGTLCSTPNVDRYQMAFEPILAADENTRHCVCEVDVARKSFGISTCEVINPCAILYTKICAHKTLMYDGLTGFAQEAVKLLDKAPNAAVFMSEENEPLEDAMPALNPSMFNLLSESEIHSNFWDGRLYVDYKDEHYHTPINEFYMPKAIVEAAQVAKFLGREHHEIQQGINCFQKFRGVLEEVWLKNGSVAMFNTHHHSLWPFRYVLDHFFNKYPDKRKVLVYSRVSLLGELTASCNENMALQMAKRDFEEIVWLDLDSFGDVVIKNNRKVFLKRFHLKPDDFNEGVPFDVTNYIKNILCNNTAVLFALNSQFNIESVLEGLN